MADRTVRWDGTGSLQQFLDALPRNGEPLKVTLPAAGFCWLGQKFDA